MRVYIAVPWMSSWIALAAEIEQFKHNLTLSDPDLVDEMMANGQALSQERGMEMMEALKRARDMLRRKVRR